MAELVLREAGWNANSLGDNLPFATLAAAIEENRPRLFWISASHIDNEGTFLNGYQELYSASTWPSWSVDEHWCPRSVRK